LKSRWCRHASGFSGLSLAGGALVLDRLRRSGLSSGPIVDLGCGAGEWAGLASASGFDAVGVDVSRAMIELARSRFPSVRFVTGSLWEFELAMRLSAVTAFGETLNYGVRSLPSAAGLAELFRRVGASLVSGGVFAFDVVVGGEEMRYRSWTDETEYTVLVDVSEDLAAARLTRSISVFTREPDCYRRSDEVHVLRVYDDVQIERALSAAGMSFLRSDAYGAFALGPRRAAFVAARP
jgi:SAM-dependent methyltransferase